MYGVPINDYVFGVRLILRVQRTHSAACRNSKTFRLAQCLLCHFFQFENFLAFLVASRRFEILSLSFGKGPTAGRMTLDLRKEYGTVDLPEAASTFVTICTYICIHIYIYVYKDYNGSFLPAT
jgi:hypothetical protein